MSRAVHTLSLGADSAKATRSDGIAERCIQGCVRVATPKAQATTLLVTRKGALGATCLTPIPAAFHAQESSDTAPAYLGKGKKQKRLTSTVERLRRHSFCATRET